MGRHKRETSVRDLVSDRDESPNMAESEPRECTGASTVTESPVWATMTMENVEIAAVFDTVADLLEIQEANPFRVRAYRNAVRTVGDLGRPLVDMVAAEEDLTELPGVGRTSPATSRSWSRRES